MSDRPTMLGLLVIWDRTRQEFAAGPLPVVVQRSFLNDPRVFDIHLKGFLCDSYSKRDLSAEHFLHYHNSEKWSSWFFLPDGCKTFWTFYVHQEQEPHKGYVQVYDRTPFSSINVPKFDEFRFKLQVMIAAYRKREGVR